MPIRFILPSKKRESHELSVDPTRFLNQIAHVTPALITVYNVHTGKYIYINKALKTLLGYEQKDWMEKDLSYVTSLLHPDDYQQILEQNKDILARENARSSRGRQKIFDFEYRIKHANGKWIWLHSYGIVFNRNNEGEVEHVLNVSLDITKRKEQEITILEKDKELEKLAQELEERVKARTKELEESRDHLREVQKLSKIGSWEYDLKTKKITWSREVFDIYGIDRSLGEPSLRALKSFFPDYDKQEKVFDEVITNGKPYQADVPYIYQKDKSLRYHLVVGKPVLSKSGKVNKIYGTIMDITERKQIELNMKFLADASKALSSSLDYEETMKTVARLAVPHIADWCSIEMLNEEGQLEQVVVAHKDPEKIQWAKELRERTGPPDMSAPTGLPHVLRTGEPEFYPLITDEMLVKIAKSKRQLSLLRSIGFTSAIIVPICSKGKAIGGITFVTTESRRRFTQTDFTMANELASRVSLAVENARLYKEAQDAVSLRDEFISIASHELKTPVTSLKVYTQVLTQQAKKRGDTTIEKYLLKMDDQINKLTKLIHDLLEVSRIQVGKLQYTESYFSIDGVVKDIVENLQRTSERHKLILTGKTTGQIYGDKDRIGQIIINLLTNAIKYSPKADKVLISLSQRGEKIFISVQDFGIGIDQAYQEKIFQRFFQVNDPEEKTFPGLGIGLYLSQEIAKRHGGTIDVKSKKGEGSTFTLVLPAAKK